MIWLGLIGLAFILGAIWWARCDILDHIDRIERFRR